MSVLAIQGTKYNVPLAGVLNTFNTSLITACSVRYLVYQIPGEGIPTGVLKLALGAVHAL